MNNELTIFETEAINMFANLDETIGSILKDQLQTAKIHRELLGSAYIVIFDVEKKNRRFHVSRRVPIEIVLDPQFAETKTIRSHGKPISLNVSENAIGLQLHFQEGILIELEIYSLSCKELQLDMYDSSKAVYLIYDDDFCPS